MRKSSSHAGFNNRNQARRGWQMEVEWEEKKLDEEVKHRSPYSRPPLTSFPIPPRLFLFVTLSLLETATLERALHPPPREVTYTNNLLYSAIPFLVSMRHVYLLMYLLVFRYVPLCSNIRPTFFLSSLFFFFIASYQSVRNIVDNFKASPRFNRYWLI